MFGIFRGVNQSLDGFIEKSFLAFVPNRQIRDAQGLLPCLCTADHSNIGFGNSEDLNGYQYFIKGNSMTNSYFRNCLTHGKISCAVTGGSSDRDIHPVSSHVGHTCPLSRGVRFDVT